MITDTNIQMKSITARLLAQENIQIEYGKFSTAFFDVTNRILGMPLWALTDEEMIDMLIGHEVSHALHTPPEGWHTATRKIPGCPRSYINIVEDIRIERLILAMYPGLLSHFLRGYRSILKKDIFKMEGRDIRSYGFMDRLNIKSKFRTLVDVPFTSEEMYYVDLAMNCETFDEVLDVCREIHEWLKDRGAEQKQSETAQTQVSPQGADDSSDNDQGADDSSDNDQGADADADDSSDNDQSTSTQGDEDGDSSQDDEDGDVNGSGSDHDEDQLSDEDGGAGADVSDEDQNDLPAYNTDVDDVETDRLQREAEETSAHTDTSPATYRAPSAAQIGQLAYSHSDFVKSWNINRTRCDNEYAEFMREIGPRVKQMVKEFEMRKAAYRSKRARVSSRGSLDVSKLHRYKFDDQLFSQVTTLADAKNHGMLMLVDFSMSMSDIIDQTLRQTLIMCEFCRRVQIPFEVWSFTSGMCKEGKSPSEFGLSSVNMSNLRLINLINSKLPRKQYQEAAKVMFKIRYSGSNLARMGFTPLNQAALAMGIKLDEFKKINKLDKTALILLTDGMGSSFNFDDANDHRAYQSPAHGEAVIIGNDVIRLPGSSNQQRADILDYFRRKGHNILHMHVGKVSELSKFHKQFGGDSKISSSEWLGAVQQVGVATADDVLGCDRVIGITTNSLSTKEQTTEITSTHQSSINKAFRDTSNRKKSSKIIAKKFAEMVA